MSADLGARLDMIIKEINGNVLLAVNNIKLLPPSGICFPSNHVLCEVGAYSGHEVYSFADCFYLDGLSCIDTGVYGTSSLLIEEPRQ